MKKKILNIMLLGIMVFGITGTANAARKQGKSKSVRTVTRNNTTGNYIGIYKAKSIALKKVPGANSSHVTKIELDREHGRMVYEGEIYYKELEYDFDIDAVTGEVLKWRVDRD